MRELGLLENDRQTLYAVSMHYKNFLYGFEQVRQHMTLRLPIYLAAAYLFSETRACSLKHIEVHGCFFLLFALPRSCSVSPKLSLFLFGRLCEERL